MYPRNAATPPTITIGQVVQISDGAVQTTGASVRVKTGSGAWGAGSGTLACDTTSGVWTYAPTQGETDAEAFLIAVYKASCIGCDKTVVTSASATAGYAGTDQGKIANPTSTVALSGTTISTSQQIASVSGAVGSVTGAVGSVTGNVGGNVTGSVGSVVGAVGSVSSGVTVSTNNDKTGYLLSSGGLASVTTWTVAITGNITGNLSGSVGSVSGNVGGNVLGSVGSISGVTFPSNFGALVITAGGVVDADLETIKGQTVTCAAGVTIGVYVGGTAAAATATALSSVDSKLGTIIDIGGGATIGANLDHINGQVDTTVTILNSLGLNGSGMSAIPWNAAWDAEVQSEVADALAAFWTSPEALVDLIWDEATSGHATAGTNGKALTDALADTSELQTDWANGGRLDLILDAIAADVALVLADTGTDGVVLSAATCNKIADHVRRRTQANVEASSDGDTLNKSSEYGLIQQIQKSNTTDTAGFLTIKKTDGTTLGTLALASDPDAEPVTGVS